MYGHATSLTTLAWTLLVQYDQGSAEDHLSKLIAINGATGDVQWEAPRDVGNSWSTPIVVGPDSGEQIVTCAMPWVIAYSAEGREIWRAKCLDGDVAPSPVFAGGRVIAVNTGSALVSIDPAGRGDVTDTHVKWTYEDDLPDIVSPVSDGKYVWILSYGILTCLDAGSGKKLWDKEYELSFTSSPSLVGGKMVLVANDGVVIVAEPGAQYKETAQASLGEDCRTCPAFAAERIYVRGVKNLICIAAPNK
jgi:outer membrane protein assembly factor BamB